MCSIKAPKPEPIKIDKPQYLHNPYLDDARNGGASADALRTGRSALRIPLDTGLGIGFQGRGGSQEATAVILAEAPPRFPGSTSFPDQTPEGQALPEAESEAGIRTSKFDRIPQ